MTIKANSTELDIARRARKAAREKMDDHIGSPNLTRSGAQKSLVAPTPQAPPTSTSAPNKEYGNGREKSVQQVEREVVGDTIKLQGKARAVVTAIGNVAQKKQALKLLPNLTVPITIELRPANNDGATSFHFKHDSIAKTIKDKTSAKGTNTRKNAGRDHAKYLERDSALARIAGVVDGLRSLDGKNVEANALGGAAECGLYIEREEALAHHENGVAVVYSNISQDANERQEFWALVEEHESEPKPDHLEIVTGQDPDFWEAVRTDLRCPKNLAQAIEHADPNEPYCVRTDDNQFVREIMAVHGWAPPLPSKLDETTAEMAQRKRVDQENSKGADCQDGRGGRIQNRIVGELPDEASHEGRIRILRKFTAVFESRNLPYVAVMHAPDHANNDKNWHFHLAYYERPCSRFTGEAEDHLGPEPVGKALRHQDRYRIRKKALESVEIKKYIGEWDFAVPYSHKKKSRTNIVTYPFWQDKSRECNKRDWPLRLRKLLAEIVNDELEMAGVDRRIDPRRFSEMGIDKEAEKHLGTRSAQMECLGIATPQGVENEHRQWEFIQGSIDKKFERDARCTLNEERLWRQALECRELNPDDEGEVSEMITRWAQIQAEADEQTAIANELAQLIKRAQSRAIKVRETCMRHLAAIDQGKANKRQADNKAKYEARLTEATDHISGLTVVMATEIVQEKRSRNEAVRLMDEAANLSTAIDARLKGELVAMMAAPVLVKVPEKEAAGIPTQKVPAAHNHYGKIEIEPGLDHGHSGRALRQSEIELFMRHIVENNRRLTTEGNHLVPLNPDDEEKRVISAPNYADLQRRLRMLKDVQDRHIGSLSQFILNNPDSIKVVPGKAGASEPRFEIRSDNGTLQRAFKGFANDGLIKAAINTALEARQNIRNELASASPSNIANRTSEASEVPDGTSGLHKPAAASHFKSKDQRASPTQVMRAFDDFAAAATPVLCAIKGGKSVFSLAEQAMETLGWLESDLTSVQAQTRLRGIHKQQEGDIKRLVGFIRRSPERAMIIPPTLFPNGPAGVALARNAPADLRDLAIRYAMHPDAQKQMSDALHIAMVERTAKLDPYPEKDSAPTIEGGSAGSSAPRPTGIDALKIDASDLTKPLEVPADLDDHEPPSNNVDEISVLPQPRAAETVSEPAVIEGVANLKSAAEKLAPSTVSPEPGDAPALNAEERAEILRPRTFGMTGGSQPARVAARAEGTAQDGGKPTGIPRGAHPKIDAWIQALDSHDREARQIAALALKNDHKALRVAWYKLDPKTQARIRMDWEAQEARAREIAETEFSRTKDRSSGVD